MMALPLSIKGDVAIRDMLLEIDQHDDISVNSWEAEFMETAVIPKINWSIKQRAVAHKICQRYHEFL
jgi:hypothetical protein